MEKAEDKDRQYQGLNSLATAVENPLPGNQNSGRAGDPKTANALTPGVQLRKLPVPLNFLAHFLQASTHGKDSLRICLTLLKRFPMRFTISLAAHSSPR